MDRSDDDNLFAELRALRPTPPPEFTAELDERAAAGFPRGASTSAAAMPFAKLADWWHSSTPTRRLVPVLTVALAALVVATGIVALAQSGGGGSSAAEDAALGVVTPRSSGSLEESAGPSRGGPRAEMKPAQKTPPRSDGSRHGPAETSSETTYGPEVPSIRAAPEAAAGAESGESAGAEAESAEEESAQTQGDELHAGEGLDAAPATGVASRRNIERSAYVVLGTKPGRVAAASARVYEAVHAADGIVLHSSVQSGKTGATGASFDLLIPSRKLDDALAAFSQIAEVRERHDATNDITAPTVGAAEELADSNAAIEGLLKELGDAETEEERESVEARLREVRGRHATIRSSLDRLHERSSMSEVSVRIVTGQGAGVVPPRKGNDDGGAWGVGDALHDAGDILTTAAGVALIALAILGPIALIAILLWGGNRFRVRRLRERTLG